MKTSKLLTLLVFALLLTLSVAAVRATYAGRAYYATPTVSTSLSTTPTTGLALPAAATGAVLQAQGGDIRYSYSAEAVTGDTGLLLANNQTMVIVDERLMLKNFRFIRKTGDASTLHVEYFHQ